MLHCPHHDQYLVRARHGAATFWYCRSCHGRALPLKGLGAIGEGSAAQVLWNAANRSREKGRRCPSCNVPTRLVDHSGKSRERMELDVCTSCYLVWFDPGEYERLFTRHHHGVVDLDPKARDAMANEARLHEFENSKKVGFHFNRDFSIHHLAMSLLSLPIEEHPHPLKIFPAMTWLLVGVVAVVSAWAFGDYKNTILEYGFYPEDPFKNDGFNMLASFFLHGGWLHLLGNLYFLVIFGDNVEEYLGKLRYLMLLGISLLAAHYATVQFATSNIPHIGASGGIFGLEVFYMLQFPKARLRFFYIMGLISFRIRVIWFLPFTLAMQFLGAYMQQQGAGTQIGYLPHLGGMAGGLAVWLILGGASRRPESAPA